MCHFEKVVSLLVFSRLCVVALSLGYFKCRRLQGRTLLFFLNRYLHCVDFKASICVIPIEPVFQWVLNTFQVIACNSLICCRL